MNDIRSIFNTNTFHARMILLIIYFEKKFWIKMPFKIVRKIVVQMIYNCEIHPDSFTSLEAIYTCRLPHPYTIIIHKSAKIGVKSTIFQGVTIGVIEKEDVKDQAAVIGDNVYIGCKASLLGNLNIGSNVRIGAHSLVLKNVLEGTTVTGLFK